MPSKMTFEEWMIYVDAWLYMHLGLSSRDLPDRPYYDEYEDGMTPRQAAMECLRYAGAEFGG